jgi:hypothetical protein
VANYLSKLPRLPPGCGDHLGDTLLYNPYQQAFQEARRTRFCLTCKTQGMMDPATGLFTCVTCKQVHATNLTAPRVFDRLLVLAGRGGGKTLIGAHACREELLVPNSLGWVMGPTYKILHDSTFPTLIGLINPDWVKTWDAEHMELTLKNGAKVAFRSLEDPERARGPHGVSWGWFDEAAQAPERAYDVFEPTLIKAGGIIIATTTVFGFDWTYDKIEKRALVYHEPGYWACKYWTEENPLFASSPVMRRQIERAKATMTPEFYEQEYKAERRNATGLIYDYKTIERQCLLSDDEVKKLIPEWPSISPSRPIIIGLDSGADHPFGAVMIVVTPHGLVCVREYLERNKAISLHLPAILNAFQVQGFAEVKWAANKNEKNLRLEFALKGIGVIPAESAHEIGIQRVQSWLHAKQMWFAYTCPRTIDQMRAYRYADNIKPSTGEKTAKEQVFKLKDELPDGVRYAVMAWPELPVIPTETLTDAQRARWDALDERSQLDIERVREYNAARKGQDLTLDDASYPLGDFYGGETSDWR